MLAGAFPLSSNKMSEPDVAVVWLELFADHDGTMLTEAARRVCFNEQFPSVAALHRHYQAAIMERNDDLARIEAAEPERDNMPTSGEVAGYIDQFKQAATWAAHGNQKPDNDNDDDCGGRDPYADLGYEKR